VFDFDGTIIDTETPNFRAWQTVFAEEGAELLAEDFVRCIGTRRAFDWGELLATKLGRPGPGQAELFARKQPLNEAAIAESVPRPGVVEWMEEARAAGLRIAIASSSERWWIEPKLAQHGLDRFVEHISSWEGPDGGIPPKPAPDLYLHACAALGVEPSRAVAVEDSSNGVLSAKAAGLACVAVPGSFGAHMDLAAADLVLESFEAMTLATALATLE
jgi:HAD superfamily hydrolase (TIGR01509 family)